MREKEEPTAPRKRRRRESSITQKERTAAPHRRGRGRQHPGPRRPGPCQWLFWFFSDLWPSAAGYGGLFFFESYLQASAVVLLFEVVLLSPSFCRPPSLDWCCFLLLVLLWECCRFPPFGWWCCIPSAILGVAASLPPLLRGTGFLPLPLWAVLLFRLFGGAAFSSLLLFELKFFEAKIRLGEVR